MSPYDLDYEPKEINKKIRAMFNVEDLQVASKDGAGRVIRYYLTDSQTLAFLDRWNPLKNTFGIREKAALSTIEQLLGIKLERQVEFGRYRVDGYHRETNTVYEIDEPQHFIDGKLKEECIKRQSYIEKKLKCKFVRIKV